MAAVLLILAQNGDAQSAPKKTLTLDGKPPLIFAHRGASGYLPEETMEAYEKAESWGPVYLEGDLYFSKDGVLTFSHDSTLNRTTNVAEAAKTDPSLAAAGVGDLKGNIQYPIAKLNLADIKKLKVLPGKGTFNTEGIYDPGHSYRVITFKELLDHVYEVYQKTGRVVGICPEAKIKGAIADAMLNLLADPKYHGLFDGSKNNVILQSFPPETAKYWRSKSKLPVVQLLGRPPEGADKLAAIAAYTDIIGPSVKYVTPEFVQKAHAAGLKVYPYTLTNAPDSYEKIFAMGVDGVFTNNGDIALKVRDEMFGTSHRQ